MKAEISDFRRGNGDALHCACCNGNPHVQVYGFYLCKDCNENKVVHSYEDRGVLHVSFVIGRVLVH